MDKITESTIERDRKYAWGIRSGGTMAGSDEDQINIYRKADIGDVE